MGANDYMYTGVQRDAAATVSKRQPYCVLINYVASSLFVYVATTLTILRRPIEACYVGSWASCWPSLHHNAFGSCQSWALPGPAGGAYSAPTDHLAGFGGEDGNKEG